jgi:Glycosyl hydrolase family 79 C-terminal beta domain
MHSHVRDACSSYDYDDGTDGTDGTTAPPTGYPTDTWTIGPVYYAALAMAEMLGNTKTAQIVDLGANWEIGGAGGNWVNGSEYTPAYAVYERGVPMRLGLFNFVSDPSGASDVVVNVSVPAGPSEVRVKYLSASSVTQTGNFTWAGQTFGGSFASNGLPLGTETIKTITCPPSEPCPIPLPAPCFALVFLTTNALAESGEGGSTTTFAQTVSTPEVNTATVDPGVLATSNGRKTIDGHLGSTSKGSADVVNVNGAGRVVVVFGYGVGVVLGVLGVLMR